MPLSAIQLDEAVSQMKIHCDLKMADYEMVSARSVLNELGFPPIWVEQILQHLYDSGFTYCLDPDYHKGSEDRISAGVCYFGPDQLKDRLP